MTYLANLATRLFNVPLLITPEYGSVVTTVLADRVEVQPMAADDVVQSYNRPHNRAVLNPRTGIVTLPVVGGLIHRGSLEASSSGGNMMSYTRLHTEIDALFADDKVRGVLLDIDSGGGEAAGLAELVDYIPKASKQAGKPVWTIANTSAGSAAYWLASIGDRLFAAPNSRVGSVGVYVQHVDMSKAVEKRGMVVSFIYAGDHKIDGNPFGPLPDDVRANIQAGVNSLYGDFVSAVASNRKLDEKVVRDTQARVYGPAEAYELGLVDGVGGLGSVLSAFAERLNRPFAGYSSNGSQMKELIHSAADLESARAEGVATGKSQAATTITDLNSKLDAAATDRKALLTAFSEIAGDNPKVAIFVEALNEGGSVALASKMAAKVDAPKAAAPAAPTKTQADVDAFMAGHAPNVSDSGGTSAEVDPKAARMAEIAGAAASFNKNRGFTRA